MCRAAVEKAVWSCLSYIHPRNLQTTTKPVLVQYTLNAPLSDTLSLQRARTNQIQPPALQLRGVQYGTMLLTVAAACLGLDM